jgi:hypothetical protein
MIGFRFARSRGLFSNERAGAVHATSLSRLEQIGGFPELRALKRSAQSFAPHLGLAYFEFGTSLAHWNGAGTPNPEKGRR